ncbi:MAG TPA: hypothetical protein VLC07_05790, partial [Solirubrobacterales bacterium]|nr:hypothetical protein [Solirubrobacterales bacterium]
MRRPDPNDRVLRAGHGLRRRLVLTALCAALGMARPAAPGFLAGRELAPGMRVSDRLAAGEHRIYPVRLRAGELLHLFVREEDGDVAVLLRDAGGALVAHADGPRPPQEDEELAAVAPRDGGYRLEIAASRPGDPPGRYRLEVAELRPAGERDRRLARALAATQAAAELAAGPGERIAARARSLALWRALGDGRRVAEALFRMGKLRLMLDEDETAAVLLHQAIEGYRAAGDRAGLAEALDQAARADLRLLRPR